jgi:hypothetical protein
VEGITKVFLNVYRFPRVSTISKKRGNHDKVVDTNYSPTNQGRSG